MDTDDLSEEAYKVVITSSDLFHRDLTLQFGSLSYHCENEDEYLKQALLLIKTWESDIEYAIDEIFYEMPPEINKFRSKLESLTESINNVIQIPVDKRTKTEW